MTDADWTLLPVIDKTVIANLRRDIDDEMLAEIFVAYAGDADLHAPHLWTKLAEGDLNEADISAHALKGASANLGLRRLAGCSDSIHQALRRGLVEEAATLNGPFREVFRETREAVVALIATLTHTDG